MQKHHPTDQIIGDLNSGVHFKKIVIKLPSQAHVAFFIYDGTKGL